MFSCCCSEESQHGIAIVNIIEHTHDEKNTSKVPQVPQVPQVAGASAPPRSDRTTGISQLSQPSQPSRPSRLRLRRGRLGTMDESELPEVVTFGDQKDLLRASMLSLVLRCGAAIFRRDEVSVDMYALSEEVQNIDSFISHNWVSSRIKKFFCLVLHFNLGMAVLATLVALAMAALLGSQGFRALVLPPEAIFFNDPTFGTVQQCCNAKLVTSPVFLLVAFFGRDLQYLAGLRGSSAFIDKTCMHQTNKERQRQGILKLGAFLRSSSQMVALYSDVYLTKLWTVYEVACFLALRPANRLVVVTIYQPILVFGAIAINYVSSLWWPLVLLNDWQSTLFVVVGLVALVGPSFGCAILFRLHARHKQAIHNRMENFQIQYCSCYSEADRPLVQRNIALLLTATGDVGPDSAEQHVLTTFNNIVRASLPKSLLASIGSLGFQYRQIAAIYLCAGATADIVDVALLGTVSLEEWVAGAGDDYQEDWVPRLRVCLSVFYATYAFGAYPLGIAMLSKYSQCCIDLRGCCEWAFVFAVLFFVYLFMHFGRLGHQILVLWAASPGPHRDAWLVVLVLLLPVLALLAYLAFNRGRSLGEEVADSEESGQQAIEACGEEIRSARI